MLPSAKPDEHLSDARDLVLRAGGVFETEAASHAEDVEGGGALHRGALRDGKEVVTITAGTSSASLGEGQRNRRGCAFELIAKGGTCGLREGGNHRGELEGDLEHSSLEELASNRRMFRRQVVLGRP